MVDGELLEKIMKGVKLLIGNVEQDSLKVIVKVKGFTKCSCPICVVGTTTMTKILNYRIYTQ